MEAPEVRGDTAAAVEFLRRWEPRGPWLLAAIHPHVENSIEPARFEVGNELTMRAWIEARQGNKNLYFSVNRPRGSFGGRASKADIGAALAIHVDVDPRDGEDLAAERTAILGLIHDLRPAPTVIIDSGGGYQAFWKLREAVEIPEVAYVNRDTGELAGPGVPEITRVERYNRGVRDALHVADHCQNIDRIMRLPGTINVPTTRKLAKGRSRAATSFTANWDLVYGLEDLSRFAELVAAQEAFDDARAAAESPDISWDVVGQLRIELDELPIPEELKALVRDGNLPGDGGRGQRYRGRSEAVFGALTGMVRAEVTVEVMAAILLDRRWAIGAHVREQKQVRRYLTRQITRARAAIRDVTIAALNEEFAVVSARGKVVILHEHAGTDGYDVFDLMSRASFKTWTENLPPRFNTDANGRTTATPIADVWLRHPLRRQYTGIVFKPNGTERSWYNIWNGFAIEPAASGAGCERFLDHLRDNVAQRDDDIYRWVVSWFADIIQNPGRKTGTALVLRGRQGVGKTIVGKTMRRLLGPHYAAVSDARGLTGQFNAHLASALLVHADEAFWAGDKTSEGRLKDLVTGETQWIEFKNVEMFQVDNYIRLLITGNQTWLVPAGLEERRFAVIDVGEDRMQDIPYFAVIDDELDNGGAAALLRFLKDWRADDVNIRVIPRTVALTEQKIQSLGSEGKWWLDQLMAGIIPMCIGTGKDDVKDLVLANVCPIDELFESYLKHARDTGNSRRSAETSLGIFLQRVIPGVKRERRTVRSAKRSWEHGQRKYIYQIASLAECRSKFDELLNTQFDWPPGPDDWVFEQEENRGSPF